MAKRKKEQANTEQKDYKAKARGKYPDDISYPLTEQHELNRKSSVKNSQPKDRKDEYRDQEEKNPAAPDKISNKEKASSINKDNEFAGTKYHRKKNKKSA